MDMKLEGQRVLVTAASKGIGFGAAKAFLEEGARVVINSSNAKRLNDAKDRLKSIGEIHALPADISLHAEIDKLVDGGISGLGGLDVLVHVTGPPKPGTFLELGYDDWMTGARSLVVGPAYMAKRVAEHMIKAQTKGRMVFLSSYVIREPVPSLALSDVCRISSASLVRTLARELAPRGIRVNGIMPGYIQTDRIDQVVEATARRRGISRAQALAEIESTIPLGRIGTTEELARVILFLGSEVSSYVSGTLIPVDGALLKSVG